MSPRPRADPDPAAPSPAAASGSRSRRGQALVAFTQSGDTARRLAGAPPPIPLLAFTPDPRVRSQLTLVWGVETFLVPFVKHTDEMVRQVDQAMLEPRPDAAGRPSDDRRRQPALDRRLDQRAAGAPARRLPGHPAGPLARRGLTGQRQAVPPVGFEPTLSVV